MSNLRDLNRITNRADLEAAMEAFPSAILKTSVARGLIRYSGSNDRAIYFLTDVERCDAVQVDGRTARAFFNRGEVA